MKIGNINQAIAVLIKAVDSACERGAYARHEVVAVDTAIKFIQKASDDNKSEVENND